jgi:hypothetical protein
MEEAEQFKSILNHQDPAIKYTMETESVEKTLDFLDVTIINPMTGRYEFKIFRKQAITNVQIKPHSCVDPSIAMGTFVGFLNRAEMICSEKYITDEVNLLTDIFTENGYDRKRLSKIVKTRTKLPRPTKRKKEFVHTALLPWTPSVSQKLRKVFQKSGVRAIFKSAPNLETILTAKNKPKLPKCNHPGVYQVQCSCGKSYVGETGAKISTRINQHKKDVFQGQWHRTGLSEHAKSCDGEIDWTNVKPLSYENRKFKRKVTEALEIQLRETGPKHGGLNKDYGKFVATTFWEPIFARERKQSDVTINRRQSKTRTTIGSINGLRTIQI